MNVYTQLTDDVLADLLEGRDEQAFTELYHRYWGVMFSHARRMVKDDELASDAVQEIFSNLWDRSATLEIKGTIAGYLYTALRNHILNLIEKQRVRNNYLSSLEQWMEGGHQEAEEQLYVKELHQLIESEVQSLPPKMREIFELSRKAYLSYKEIADTVNISEGTVKKQIYNALKILKGRLLSMFFMLIMRSLLYMADFWPR